MSEQKSSLPKNYFDDVYSANQDPWDFESSPYELHKYQITIAALPNKKYQNVLEIGCSIGVLTKMLAPKCTHLLCLEPAEKALEQAKNRLREVQNVQFLQMLVPQDFPDGLFDLIVLSEVGYYLNLDDLQKTAGLIVDHLAPGGQLILVHWTPFVPDYPLTGDQVNDFFIDLWQQKQLGKHLKSAREEKFRLDLLEKN